MIHFVQAGYQGGQALCGAFAAEMPVTSVAAEVRCPACMQALTERPATTEEPVTQNSSMLPVNNTPRKKPGKKKR